MTTKGDYVIYSPMPKKFALLKVSGVHNGVISGVLEKGAHIEEQRTVLDIAPKEVILNLGPKPYPGKVYGIDLAKRYRGKKEMDEVGDVHFFYSISKEAFKSLNRAFRITRKRLTKLGLEQLLIDPMVWEVEKAEGQKYSGMYTAARKEGRPVISIRPELMTPDQYPYVISHELGHHLDFAYLVNQENLQARWMELYNTSVKVVNTSRKELKELYSLYVDTGDSPKAFMASLQEEDKLKFRKVLKIIRSHKRFSINDLQLLYEQGKSDVIEQLWPAHDIPDREPDPLVTEYATKNVGELFAEAFAFYVTGVKLPKSVTRLMEKSIAYAKTQV